ncbi:MAG: hypothetical protein KH230_24635 [Enterocloster asparagiformis]|nr:hypothetical protein [Enterocloster asparagiformis]
MSIAGCIILALYGVGLIIAIISNKIRKFEYNVFVGMIAVSLFINIGRSIFNLSFIYLMEYLYLFTYIIMLCLGRRKLKFKRRIFLISTILILIIGLSELHLVLSRNMPNVIPYSIRMDDVYRGSVSAVRARFSTYNIIHFWYFIIFVIIILLNYERFTDIQKKSVLLRDVEKLFIWAFGFWTLEWFSNNLISSSIWRNVVFEIFGVEKINTIYYQTNRFGFWGFSGFYSEQSYVSIMFIFYSIYYIKKELFGREWLVLIWSSILLVLNGSTTGLAMLPFVIIIIVKNVFKGATHKKIFNRIIISVVAILGVSVFAILQNSLIRIMVNSTILKISAYLTGGFFSSTIQTSAAIRQYGNAIAYNAFKKSPILGVGIGTTRGYGIITGALACMGVAGIISYLLFIKASFKVCFNREIRTLCIIILIYFSMILSVWYLYYPTIIPLYLALSQGATDYNKKYSMS